MNPILTLIDNALKWAARPTRDGASIVRGSAATAESYIESSAAIYVVRSRANFVIVEELKSGRSVEAPTVQDGIALIQLGLPVSGAV